MKIDLKALFKKLTPHRNSLSGHRNPNRDWLIILQVFGFLFIIVFTICAYVFLGIDRETIFKPRLDSAAKPPTVDQTSINTLSSYYQTKEDTLEKLKTSQATTTDPSL